MRIDQEDVEVSVVVVIDGNAIADAEEPGTLFGGVSQNVDEERSLEWRELVHGSALLLRAALPFLLH